MQSIQRFFQLAFLLFFFSANAQTVLSQHLEWVKQVMGNAETQPKAVATDPWGNIITVGVFYNTIDLDPGPGTFTIVAAVGGNNTFVQKLDSNGNFLWGATVASNAGYNGAKALQIDSAGNLTMAGYIHGTADFDIGAGIDSLTAANGIYLLRVSATGQYLGARVMQNATLSSDMGSVLSIDTAANIYMIGGHWATVDVDLGVGVQQYTAVGSEDCFVVSYDSNFALRWSLPLSSSGQELGHSIASDTSGVYVTGRFNSQTDVDPGPGTYFLHTAAGVSGFIIKYGLGGQLIWAGELTSSSSNLNPFGIDLDRGGDVVVCGSYSGLSDMDPTAGVSMISNVFGDDIFAVRLNRNGQFLWVKHVGGMDADQARNVTVDAAGSVYLSTLFYAAIDMDPGPGMVQLTVVGPNIPDAALLKLDAVGNFVWVAELSGNGLEMFADVEVNDQGSIYAVGSFQQTVDFDPSSTASYPLTVLGYADAFFLHYSQDSCTDLGVQIDSVANVTCAGQQGFMSGHATNGHAPYAYQWNTAPPTLGMTANTTIPGIYTLQATDLLGCTVQRAVVVDGSQLPNGFDLQVNLVAGVFRPGIATNLVLDAFNAGCVPISGQVKLALDAQVTYQTATPLPASIIGDTLVWNFPSMNFDSAHFIANITVLTDTTANNFDTLQFAAIVTPSLGDQQPLDNFRLDYEFPVVNSYDPNQISVYPPGHCEERYVQRGTPLTYTVQFQNTGTAEALEVMIVDSIEANLDFSTMSFRAASHPMILEVGPGNVLKFMFHNIHLPDSTTNEPASHGYVIYDILPQSGIQSGTVVHNQAAIYFDFNAPVWTNITSNTIVDVIPACAVGVAENEHDELSIYPNPASEQLTLRSTAQIGAVTVHNLLGQSIFYTQFVDAQELQIDVAVWPKGIYLLHAQGKVRRIVVQ